MPDDGNFQPDWVSPPGETIIEILHDRRLSLNQFADNLGCTVLFANELLKGRVSFNEKLAKRLEETIGSSASFWSKREAQFRADISRLNSIQVPENKEWIREIPVKDMIKFGWIAAVATTQQKLDACLEFFDVLTAREWRQRYRSLLSVVAFRTSTAFVSSPAAVLTWLRRGEIIGKSLSCQSWNQEAFAKSLSKARELSRIKDPKIFLPLLQKLCANSGVALVITRAPEGCRASGATRFLASDRALIQLSFRYRSDDQFWFTFFHEAGHLVLHSETALFLEDDSEVTSDEENEANRFASEILIPAKYHPLMARLKLGSRDVAREVVRCAREIGISPGILIGQLQHMKRVPQNRLNGFKRHFTWADIVTQ